MISNYLDPYAPANANKWAMQDFGGETNSTYPTTFGLFNTGGSNQVGNYSNPQADKLINDSITSSDPAAVKNEAAFLTTDQPVMFQPANDRVLGVEEHAVGVEAGGLGEPDSVLRQPGVLVLQLITTLRRWTALVSGDTPETRAAAGAVVALPSATPALGVRSAAGAAEGRQGQ